MRNCQKEFRHMSQGKNLQKLEQEIIFNMMKLDFIIRGEYVNGFTRPSLSEEVCLSMRFLC